MGRVFLNCGAVIEAPFAGKPTSTPTSDITAGNPSDRPPSDRYRLEGRAVRTRFMTTSHAVLADLIMNPEHGTKAWFKRRRR